jgi:hypothetical protein
MAITTEAKLDEAALLELESSLRGELLRPDHPSYDEQRRGLERLDQPPSGADRALYRGLRT